MFVKCRATTGILTRSTILVAYCVAMKAALLHYVELKVCFAKRRKHSLRASSLGWKRSRGPKVRMAEVLRE